MINKTLSTTIILMISNVLVKFIGLARDVILANTYGTTIYSDAYVISNNIPVVLFSIVATAVSTSFVPMYSQVKQEVEKKEVLKFVNNFINILLIISLIMTIIGELFPEILVKAFASGFENEAFYITVNFTRIMLPSIMVIAFLGVTSSLLQVNNYFLPISFVTVPNNLIIIFSIIFAYTTGKPVILAIGTLIGMVSQLLVYTPFLKKIGYEYCVYVNLKDKYIKAAFIMILPVLLGAAVNEINMIIDKTLVSGLSEGSIAALNYASKLIGFLTGIFIAPLAMIGYPKMSYFSANKDFNKLKECIKNITSIMSLTIIPISFFVIYYSNDIVKIVFERGTFNEKSTYMTSIAFSAYCIGLIGIGYRDILTKAYYSLKDTRTPMINGIIGMLFNIILNLILIKKIGVVGSAIATSITSIFTSILLVNKLNEKIGSLFHINEVINYLKIFLSSFIMITICFMFTEFLSFDSKSGLVHFILLIITFLLGVIIYLISLLILKEKQILVAIKKLLRS